MAKSKDAQEVGVTEHNDNYVGVSPEYQNSAYLSNAPVTDEVNEVEQRVRDHVEAMVQPAPEVRSFQDWLGEREAAAVPAEEEAKSAKSSKASDESKAGDAST